MGQRSVAVFPLVPLGSASDGWGHGAASPARSSSPEALCGLALSGVQEAGRRGDLPVGQRDHPVGGVRLLLALDLLGCGFFERGR